MLTDVVKSVEDNDRDPWRKAGYEGSSWIMNFLYPPSLQKYTDLSIKALLSSKEKFDTIAFTGMSGALIAPIVAFEMGKNLLMVRKGSTHSLHDLEGYIKCKRYVILDDFIDTGATVKRVQKAIYNEISSAKCIGTLEVQYLDDPDYPDSNLVLGEKFQLNKDYNLKEKQLKEK